MEFSISCLRKAAYSTFSSVRVSTYHQHSILGQGDYQDWVKLGNPGCSWSDLLPYFKKSETYTPVYSQGVAEQFSIQESSEVHGYNGPVNVSFPEWFWRSSKVLFEALNELGVLTAYDPNTGLVTEFGARQRSPAGSPSRRPREIQAPKGISKACYMPVTINLHAHLQIDPFNMSYLTDACPRAPVLTRITKSSWLMPCNVPFLELRTYLKSVVTACFGSGKL